MNICINVPWVKDNTFGWELCRLKFVKGKRAIESYIQFFLFILFLIYPSDKQLLVTSNLEIFVL